MRQLQPYIHPLLRTKRKAGKCRVNHEPRRTLWRTRFVEDVVGLLRLNTKARRRELQVDVWIERPVTDLPRFGDGEALRLEDDIQRSKTVIHVFHASFGRITQLVDQRTHSLCDA